MALQDIIPHFTTDVVGVFDGETLNQVFAPARPMKATVRPRNKVMDHPLETGAIISDHLIILQTQIDLSLVIYARDYSSVYPQINKLRLDGTLLSVQTRTGVFRNMIIEEMPHDEDPGMYDMITLALRLREVQLVPDPDTYAPEEPQDQTTVANGQQTPRLKTYSESIMQSTGDNFIYTGY